MTTPYTVADGGICLTTAASTTKCVGKGSCCAKYCVDAACGAQGTGGNICIPAGTLKNGAVTVVAGAYSDLAAAATSAYSSVACTFPVGMGATSVAASSAALITVMYSMY